MPNILPHQRQISVAVTRTTADALRELAREEETTVAGLVRRLIRQALTEKRSPGVISAGAEKQVQHAESYDKNRTTG